ncbi:hypothetical protein [Aureimonas pseudogalii]|uniref:Uncharacterized protein n=1 Tax=Aureimonas pseudogalii TaxID=1744844 RepID=A0A7W6EFG6_9HYPH|nr:hypothetical protein [Aureimonas pseudogalii]MBB3996899.1 hypothetical protein [Aureimonas pseudogalii]
MAQEPVLTVSDLISRLGGLAQAAKLFGVSMQTVGNWRIRERIPSRFYFTHVAVLSECELSAPPKLWGFSNDMENGAGATECPVPVAAHAAHGGAR